VSHQMPDPQVDLVRRYARILRSAPAEAVRVRRQQTVERAAARRAPLALTQKPGPGAAGTPVRRLGA
jgi:hypothetical protein